MAWYWIVLIILGYLAISIIIAIVSKKFFINLLDLCKWDSIFCASIALIWPVVIILVGSYYLVKIVLTSFGRLIIWISDKIEKNG